MHYLDETLPEAAANLALDELLLLQAEAGSGGEVLRIWEWPAPAVVLGAGCRLGEDVDEAACQADAVPILRRSSGGGTVLLGAGCLLYSLILDQERAAELREIRSSYRYILTRIAEALAASVQGIVHAGISDLAQAGRKLSGTAQQRKRRYLLHHGTLLYAFDTSRVPCYLCHPPREPDYRSGRPHELFLANLPLDASRLKQLLQLAWQASSPAPTWPAEQVRRLVEEKYGTEAWIRRR